MIFLISFGLDLIVIWVDTKGVLGSFKVALIGYLLGHLFDHLFDKDDKKESDK